jgi:uncharacterized protein with PIN domain
MEKFRLFFAGLSPDRYCIGCLARISETSEEEVRNELQALAEGLEVQIGECRNCGQRGQTYQRRLFMPDPACAECGNPILPTDDKITFHNVPYHYAVCWERKTRTTSGTPVEPVGVCAFCGKSVAASEVREGEQRFHLDCYVVYNRRPSGPRLS